MPDIEELPQHLDDLASVPAVEVDRWVLGAFVELTMRPVRELRIDAGVRGDLWDDDTVERTVEPRLRATWLATADASVHAAFGMTHQRASYFLSIPAFADVALQGPLQEGLQGEVGGELSVSDHLDVELQGFVHRYGHATTLAEACGHHPDCNSFLSDTTLLAFGLETLVRFEADDVEAWLSYTLARATGRRSDGTSFDPELDQRHTLGLMGIWRPGGGWQLGGRFSYGSGRPALQYPVGTGRLPGTYRLDLSVRYGWTIDGVKVWLTIDWMNVTMTRAPLGYDCASDPGVCRVVYHPLVVVPGIGARAEF